MALWAIRLFLLACVAVHIWAAVSLTLDNKKARPQSYAANKPVQATYASRTMRISGVILLAFIVFHIAHYTARVIPGKEYNSEIIAVKDGEVFNAPTMVPLVKHGEKVKKEGAVVMTFNVNDMIIAGFQVWWVSAFYIIATGLLCMHLAHGFSSMFQTIGLRNKAWRQRLDWLALGYGWVVFIGFAVIPLAALTGLLKLDPSGGIAEPVAALTETIQN